jgi:hypothetical protein
MITAPGVPSWLTSRTGDGASGKPDFVAFCIRVSTMVQETLAVLEESLFVAHRVASGLSSMNLSGFADVPTRFCFAALLPLALAAKMLEYHPVQSSVPQKQVV